MTDAHAVWFLVALVILGTVAAGISLTPSTAQFSAETTLADNHVSAGEWGIELEVDDDEAVVLDGNESDGTSQSGANETDLLVTVTVFDEYGYTEAVPVTLDIGSISVQEELVLEGVTSESVTFAIDAAALGDGEHAYTVTAATEVVEGTVSVHDGDEQADQSAVENESSGSGD